MWTWSCCRSGGTWSWKNLHEEPEVPNFATRRRGPKLKAGMTIAIEPMITLGDYEVKWMPDGWTVVTADKSLAAHYENTILITDGEPEILSLPMELSCRCDIICRRS